MAKDDRMNVVCTPQGRRQIRELGPVMGAGSDSEVVRWSVDIVAELTGVCDTHGYITVLAGGVQRRIHVLRGRLSSPGVY